MGKISPESIIHSAFLGMTGAEMERIQMDGKETRAFCVFSPLPACLNKFRVLPASG